MNDSEAVVKEYLICVDIIILFVNNYNVLFIVISMTLDYFLCV